MRWVLLLPYYTDEEIKTQGGGRARIWTQIYDSRDTFFFFFLIILFYLFIFGCIGSLLLCAGFLQLQWAGATLCPGARASHCGGFPRCGAQALGAWASVVVVHRPGCSAACEIFLDRDSNPCPLHWWADSQPLRHRGSPRDTFLFVGSRNMRCWKGVWGLALEDKGEVSQWLLWLCSNT